MSNPEGRQDKNPHAKALSDLGASKGGKARAAKLSPERLSEIAKKGALARWGVRPLAATHEGTLMIGGAKIPCANLPDGRRVIFERAMMRALGRGYSGYYSERDAAIEPAAVLPRYLAPKALRPFISDELAALLSQPIAYQPPAGGTVHKGVNAEALPLICEVWLKARDAGVLSGAQDQTAQKADMLMRGLARVGIVALVDAATGFERVRDRLALEEILNAFLLKEFAAWAKRFPDEFYQQIFRLRGWTWRGMKVNRPHAVAHYTKDIVYSRLAPGILGELEARNPMTEHGRRYKHHQLLTEDVGHPSLAQHLHAVMGLMRASQNWEGFMRLLNAAFPRRGDTLTMAFMVEPPEGKG
jgi:hypothetical protein